MKVKNFNTRKIVYEGSNEILCQLILSIRGKYEGENHFRSYRELRSVYSFPALKQIEFTHIAVHRFINMDEKLVEAMNIMNLGKIFEES